VQRGDLKLVTSDVEFFCCSVSLSFWTKMGLREKARQGLLTGSLPWGIVKGEDAIPVPDIEKAPFVLRIFEMYATGQHTDRTLAEWLNIQGQLTTRGRQFSSATRCSTSTTPSRCPSGRAAA
jgi:DNA invertase Pin-like site-specific DNA recombinase